VAIFRDLWAKHGLSLANKVVLSGGSAGGIATFIWADFVRDNLISAWTDFWVMPDSGYMIDIENLKTKTYYGRECTKNLLNITNEFIALPNEKCNIIYSGKENWKCVFS